MSNRPNRTRTPAYKRYTVQYRSSLAEALQEAGITVADFTEKMGCSRSLYFEINAGRKSPTEAYRKAAAKLLGRAEGSLFEIVTDTARV